MKYVRRVLSVVNNAKIKPMKDGHNNEKAESVTASPVEVVNQKLLDLYEAGHADWADQVRVAFSKMEEGLSKTFHDHAEAFFDQVISIVENNRETDPQKVDDFLVALKDIFFGKSPDISSELPMAKMLMVAARVNRIEEMRGLIGQEIIGEFVYDLSFSPADTGEWLAGKIEQFPVGIREDVINQLETAYSNAVANGRWSEPAVGGIQQIIDHFTESHRPLTRIVAEAAQKRCTEEMEHPSLGVLTYARNAVGGRLGSLDTTPSVADRFESNLPRGYKALVVARDVITGFDSAGMARFAARQEKATEFLTQPDTGLRFLRLMTELGDVPFFRIDVRALINQLAKLRDIFESKKSVEAFYVDILAISEDRVREIIRRGENLVPYFQSDWEGVSERIVAKAKAHLGELEQKEIPKVRFESFSKLSESPELNPFSTFTKNDGLLLAQCLRPEVRSRLEDELGVSFEEISFRSEVALFRFLSSETNDSYRKLCVVIEKYPDQKNQIIEAFVGCAEDLSFGQEFLRLCEESRGDELATFLELYSGVVLASDELQDLISVDERAGKITPELTAGYMKVATKKARVMLRDWTTDAATAHASEQEFVPDEAMLEKYRTQAVRSSLFSSIFQQARKEHGVAALDVLGGFEMKSALELSEKERGDVEAMYRANYEKKDPELCERLIQIFRERCARKEVSSYLLKDGDRTVSFLTLEPFAQSRGYHRAQDVVPKDGELYFASFNTDIQYQGASIGDTMMKKVIDESAKEHLIHADCAAFAPIGAKYIEEGFVGITFYDYKNTPCLEIVRDDAHQPKTKAISKEVFIQSFLEAELAGKSGGVQGDGYVAVKASSPQELGIEKRLLDGNVLTRYFSFGNGAQKAWCAVFERG